MPLNREIRVGGLVPFSSKDFPGQLAAVVFLQGCPWRCGYCHNPHLIPCRGSGEIPFEQVEKFLAGRVGLLDAVVFSGGEPTAQPGLLEALRSIRKMGFKTGLHTNGAFPPRLRKVLPFLDWVAVDAKTEFDRYPEITGKKGSGKGALESIRLVLESGVSCEVRTTFLPHLHTEELLFGLAKDLADLGVRNYALQVFRSRDGAPGPFHPKPGYLEKLAGLFETFSYRS